MLHCKQAHGAKVMAWVGNVDDKVLPVHWFTGSVDAAAYMGMLKTVMRSAVHGSANEEAVLNQARRGRRTLYGRSVELREQMPSTLQKLIGNRCPPPCRNSRLWWKT